MKHVILLSGGIDSAALAYWKRPDAALTVNYGQKAAHAEIHAAMQIAAACGIEHHVLEIDCSAIGAGSMSKTSARVPKSPTPEWWPFRNQLLVTLAAAWAVPRQFHQILIGTVKSDKCHGDGKLPFVAAIDRALKSQEGKIRFSAPAIKLRSEQLILRSRIPHSVIAWSHSCHVGDFACGKCRGCKKHITVLSKIVDRV